MPNESTSTDRRLARTHAAALAVLVAAAVGLSSLGTGLPASARELPLAGSGAHGQNVRVVTYDLGDTAFTDRESGTVSEVRAVVRYPARITGKLPLIIQAHGSWYACEDPDAGEWPCPKGIKPFPSYRGYDYLGQALAARGFVVASISADGINMTSFDYGDRARLINEHLRLWKQLADGRGPLTRTLSPLTGHVDLQNVATMGHSRGGKGVMWQASDKHRHEWPAGVKVSAVLPLAPVKFDDPEGDTSDTLVTGIPVGVVTSECDGAVGERGQEYLDDVQGRTHAPAYSLSLTAANHNYFNTRWTPPGPLSEDDSTCPDRELSPLQQQNALVQYATAFYERFLHGDHRFDAILTGRTPLTGVDSTARTVTPVRGR